ncbi:MAG: hypothetical protein IJC21_08550 [Lentisphaeria bacterium]|nr:hypothetical protein [Lentisphaeria bacterium]
MYEDENNDPIYQEFEKHFISVSESTAEERKAWSLDEWIENVILCSGLVYETDFPADDLSPEEWKELIVSADQCVIQFCPYCQEVLDLLTKEDFSSWSSFEICQALVLEGEWLAEKFDLSKITQEDFDTYLVVDYDEISTEEEFNQLVGCYFTDEIPAHLNHPFKKREK